MRASSLCAVPLLTALVLAGCEGGGDEPAGLDTTPTGAADPTDIATDGTAEPTGDPTTPADGEEWLLDVGTDPPEDPTDLAVFEAYLAYWEADLEALSIPDPAYQPFLDLVIDPQRERVVASLERMVSDGVRTVGALHIEPTVVSVSGPAAAIQDCLDARDTYDVDDSGAEVADSRGGLAAVMIQLVQQGGRWVVGDVRAADHDCT